MIRIILDWYRRRRLNRQRELFSYFDGRRTRRIDPMQAHRALDLHPSFTWDMGYLVEQGDVETTEIVVRAVCEVFGLERWSPETDRGMTDTEIIGALVDFTVYLDDLKKKHNPGPTLRPVTESPASNSMEGQVASMNA